MYKLHKICCILTIFLLFNNQYAQNKLLILDTGLNEPYHYDSLKEMASLAGFEVTIQNAFTFNVQDFKPYKTIFINLDPTLLQQLSQVATNFRTNNLLELHKKVTHFFLKKAMSILRSIPGMKSRTVIFGLPSLNAQGPVAQFTKKVLDETMIAEKMWDKKNVKDFYSNSINHFFSANETKSYRYDTALLLARDGHYLQKYASPISDTFFSKKMIIASFLPADSFINDTLRPWYPLGTYLYNSSTKMRFILTNSTILLANAPDEQVALLPFDSDIRNNVHTNLQNFWNHIFLIAKNSSLPQGYKLPKNVQIPQRLTIKKDTAIKEDVAQKRANLGTQYNWILKNKGISCAWTHLNSFFETYEGTQRLKSGVIKRIIDSGISMFWLQLTPELYISASASSENKAEKEHFYERIKMFTTELKNYADTENKPIPALFVGVEISGNARDSSNVAHPAVDAYDRVYPNIPCPLDVDQYWQPEFIDVIKQFAQDWQTTIGSSIPLTGVMLDLEMYHAPQQASEYTNLMDYSKLSWQKYCSQDISKTGAADLANAEARTKYLVINSDLDDYRTFLTSQAQAIGKQFKEACSSAIEKCIIGVYTPVLPISWFYLGLLSGLSTQQEPLLLATFNTQFYHHYPWLEQQNIYALHMSAVLFSKLKKSSDFSIINDYFTTHDGVWFNRYAKIEEEKTSQQKSDVEVSPLETDTLIRLIKESIAKASSK